MSKLMNLLMFLPSAPLWLLLIVTMGYASPTRAHCPAGEAQSIVDTVKGDKDAASTAIVTDTHLGDFFALLDQQGDVSDLAPFFAEDVVSEFGGDFPPEIHVGLEDTLANFEAFNQFTDNLQHEILNITRSREGGRIFVTIDTSISFDIPFFQFVGTQNVTLRFNQSCLIDRFIALTFAD